MSVIWIGLFPLPVVCGWCGYPVLLPLAPPLWPGLSWWAFISRWPWWAVGPLPVLFGPVPGDPGRPCVLWVSVLWVACWGAGSSAVDVMCFGAIIFLIIYYTVIHGDLDPYCSDFVTWASCIFCALFCLWDAKFLFQRVPGCNSIADLSLKIVFWTHKFAVGTHWYGKQLVPGPISPKL